MAGLELGIGLIKSAIDIARKLDNQDLYKKLVDVQEAFQDVREENFDLREENRQLREQLLINEQLEFRDNMYWRKRKDGTEEGPFCTKCRDSDSKLVRMHTFGSIERDGGYCPQCKTRVRGSQAYDE